MSVWSRGATELVDDPHASAGTSSVLVAEPPGESVGGRSEPETRVASSRLVRRARSGDRAAEETLLRHVLTLTHRYARARLRTYPAGAEAAADVTQEVAIAVLAALPRYDDRGVPFEALVYRIAAHKVADVQRAHARSPLTADHVASPLFDGQVPSTESHVVARDEAARAWALLETLSQRNREVLVLRVAVGMSAHETADALGMTPGGVRVAQHRALAELRARWHGRWSGRGSTA